MSDASTKRMIDLYNEESIPVGFLSGFFRSPPQNFHTTEKVTMDIERSGEDVAIVLTDLSVGPRVNSKTKYTNKEFTPPVYDEEGVLNSFDLIKRMPGDDPFQDPRFMANATREAFGIFRKLEAKIRRAIEVMASQVLSTGELTLTNQDGDALFTMDFFPKSSHLVNVGTDWDDPSPDMLGDIRSIADVIWQDGKHVPVDLVFGKSALEAFIADSEVQKYFNRDALPLGQIVMPERRGRGAVFHGRIGIGQYQFNIWSYSSFYTHPQTGNATPYVSAWDVLVLSEGARLDLTFGAIPRIVAPDPRVSQFLPPRITNSEGGMDLTTNAWISSDGRNLHVSAGTRPLTIPTAIDTFGRLNTKVT